MIIRWLIAIVMASLVGSTGSAQPNPACKPVTRYGVSGCEMLPDQSCPPGYHKQAVDPPAPRMKAPSYLMCVEDIPKPKETPPNKPANATSR